MGCTNTWKGSVECLSNPASTLDSRSESPNPPAGREGAGRNRYQKGARETQSRCRASPASGYNQKSYSVPVVFGFLFVKRDPPCLTLGHPFFLKTESASSSRAGPAGRGQGRGAPRPSQPAASRAELGREADKAFPAPSPTDASQKGGGRRAGGGGRGGGGGRRCRRDWAGLRREGREGKEEGPGGLREPGGGQDS